MHIMMKPPCELPANTNASNAQQYTYETNSSLKHGDKQAAARPLPLNHTGMHVDVEAPTHIPILT